MTSGSAVVPVAELEDGDVRVTEDAWLARVCGHPVFAVAVDTARPPRSTTHVAAGVRRHADQQSRAMYYAKAASHRIDVVRALSRGGFYVVDVLLTLARPSRAPLPGVRGSDVAIVPARPEYHEDLLDLASQSFDCTRFHLDPLLPRAVADRIKRAWLASYLDRRRGEELLVAVREGHAVGFLAVLASEFRGAPSRAIDLVAVDRRLRGRGIGRALIAAFAERHAARAEHLLVGTQVANVGAVRLYEKLGFSLVASAHVLHMHVPGGTASCG